MPSFFYGWRRKVGVLTLLIALAIMAGWIRSFFVEDLLLRGAHSHTYFTSRSGSLHWDQITQVSNEPISVPPSLRWEVRRLPARESITSDRFLRHAVWQRGGCGFLLAMAEYPDSAGTPCRRRKCVIPYWALTLPPTFLAAYLILRKSPQGKQT